MRLPESPHFRCSFSAITTQYDPHACCSLSSHSPCRSTQDVLHTYTYDRSDCELLAVPMQSQSGKVTVKVSRQDECWLHGDEAFALHLVSLLFAKDLSNHVCQFQCQCQAIPSLLIMLLRRRRCAWRCFRGVGKHAACYDVAADTVRHAVCMPNPGWLTQSQ